MNLRVGALVCAGDDEFGRVNRLILNPATRTVDALVVTGGAAPEGVVVPLDSVANSTGDVIVLALSAPEAAALPAYEETRFVAADDPDWLPPAGVTADYVLPNEAGIGAFTPPAPVAPLGSRIVENIPAEDVGVGAGAQVIATNGAAGSVREVFTAGEDDRVTHVVVRRGLLERDVVVPAEFITDITEEEVRLSISSSEMDALPPYESVVATDDTDNTGTLA